MWKQTIESEELTQWNSNGFNVCVVHSENGGWYVNLELEQSGRTLIQLHYTRNHTEAINKATSVMRALNNEALLIMGDLLFLSEL